MKESKTIVSYGVGECNFCGALIQNLVVLIAILFQLAGCQLHHCQLLLPNTLAVLLQNESTLMVIFSRTIIRALGVDIVDYNIDNL